MVACFCCIASFTAWGCGLSRSFGVAPLPSSLRPARDPQVAPSPRSAPGAVMPAPDALDAGVVRHGFDGAARVWPPGASPRGLQSAQTRSPLVPSTGVLRGAHQGFLGELRPGDAHTATGAV